MRVLNRYLLQDFLVVFLMTLLIFTFVMCIGVVVKAIDFAARGVSPMLIGRVFLYNVPFMFTFSIPMSTLTATLLLFGRLSFDGEITAMKACGLNMWQIISPPLMISIILSAVCIYISTSAAPRCRHAVRSLFVNMGVEEPLHLLEVGRFIREFPGYMIYIGDRSGTEVQDIVIYEFDDDGGIVRNIRAKTGEIHVLKDKKAMEVYLHDVRIDHRKKNSEGKIESDYVTARDSGPFTLDFANMQKKTVRKKTSDMTFVELISSIHDVRAAFPELDFEDLLRQRMTMVVEANKRLALSLSCFAFTLLGIPLGMKSKRRESSIGIGISLLLVFFFYLFMTIANSLVGSPQYRPDLIVWAPVIFCEIVGFYLIYKKN